MTILEATVRSGQLVLDSALSLPDGTRVQVRLEPSQTDPLLFLAENAVATGIPDLADQHDHHIYGTPPKQE
ncbi:MAG TPA: hypothetical protein VGN42_26400 [Pirellulales bacterium]|jgi:hypothetical protein|nr:hypothetical protein [Pirellulales bacterium]